MDNQCKLCNKIFADYKGVNKHLKSHQIKIQDYYKQFYPKKDLSTGEEIEYENHERYFNFDFKNRDNLLSYLMSAEPKQALEIIKKNLLNRKQFKNLNFAPCQVELRTSEELISIIGYDYIKNSILPIKNYYSLCESIGFKSRFIDSNFLIENRVNEISVQIDTREQIPVDFKSIKNQFIQKLDFGDYKLFNECNEVFFERKSLADFIGTLNSGYERFKNEILRAKEANAYLIILVEAEINDIENFKSLNRKFAETKVTPAYLFHNVKELLQQNDNIQFLFINKDEMEKVMLRIFYSGSDYKIKDLQYLYDIGAI